jgi:hypothetical protein
MPAEQNMQFPHRHNRDGTVDSICPRCFRTISNRNTEAELARDEFRHICEDWWLDRRPQQEEASIKLQTQ